MSETVSGVVAQVLEADDLERFAVPIEIVDGLEDGEDLAVLLTDPHPERVRRILGLPVLGIALEIPFAFLRVIPPVERLLDQGAVEIAIEPGSVEEGEEIEIAVEEAVVEETAARGSTLDRRVWLYEGVEVLEGGSA